MKKYYCKKEGLVASHKNFNVKLNPVDKLLGAKINDIEFNNEENLGEVIIHLDNGSQIEIFMTEDGRVEIASD